jgi:hypothetical protein
VKTEGARHKSSASRYSKVAFSMADQNSPLNASQMIRAANKYLTWQDICPITFNFGWTQPEFGRTKTNITKFGRTYIRHNIYISHETSMYAIPAQR